MKAALLTDIKEFKIDEVSDPMLSNDTDVLIRVGVVGVCGSDVHYFERGRIGDQVVEYPFTIGHEFAGTVEQTGSKVTRVKPGKRVAVDPAISCGKCDQCLTGRPHTCRNIRFLGCPGQSPGSLSDHIVMPEENCFPLPENLSLDEGALSEPLSIGLYAVKQSGLEKDMNIGILGHGPIGMSVYLTAKAYGAGNTYVTDKLDPRLDIARQAGAKETGNPDEEDIVRKFNEAEPSQLDVVFECCGEQDALDNAVDLVKPGGKIMIVGIPATDWWSFDQSKGRRKEITFINVRRQNGTVQETLDLMASGK
ncbi:MAG: zinc-dependent alcohol dehydrogenase, partial [bacterium]